MHTAARSDLLHLDQHKSSTQGGQVNFIAGLTETMDVPQRAASATSQSESWGMARVAATSCAHALQANAHVGWTLLHSVEDKSAVTPEVLGCRPAETCVRSARSTSWCVLDALSERRATHDDLHMLLAAWCPLPVVASWHRLRTGAQMPCAYATVPQLLLDARLEGSGSRV